MNDKKKENHWFRQWYVLYDSTNKKSISYSMVVYSFFAVLLWFLLSITDEVFGFKIRQFSGSDAAMYLGPIFAIYFGRKSQKANDQSNNQQPPSLPPSPPGQ